LCGRRTEGVIEETPGNIGSVNRSAGGGRKKKGKMGVGKRDNKGPLKEERPGGLWKNPVLGMGGLGSLEKKATNWILTTKSGAPKKIVAQLENGKS